MKRSVVSLFSLLLLGACTNPDDGQGQTCTGKCDNTVVETIAFSCEPDGAEIACKSAMPADFPVSWDLTLATFDGRNVAQLQDGSTFRAPAGTELMAMVSLGSPQQGLFHADGDSQALDSMNRTITLPAGKSSYALPYDLWRVQLSGDATMVNAELAPQSFAIKPWQTFLHSAEQVDRARAPLPSYHQAPVEILLLVERGRPSITGKAQLCVTGQACTFEAPIAFDGPGAYVVSGTGVHRPGATPDEPPPSTGTSDLGSSPDLVPAPPTDPTPDCGGEGQARCNVNGDHVCDEHFVHSSSDNKCHACGADNQPRCNVNGDYVCDEHFVHSSSDNKCHACGADNQPRCNVNGDYVCDEHFVHSSSDNKCHACGADGQPRCNVNGDYVCDEGHIFLSSDSRCHACGQDGQIRCRVNGELVCDPGLTYSSGDGLCHTP